MTSTPNTAWTIYCPERRVNRNIVPDAAFRTTADLLQAAMGPDTWQTTLIPCKEGQAIYITTESGQSLFGAGWSADEKALSIFNQNASVLACMIQHSNSQGTS